MCTTYIPKTMLSLYNTSCTPLNASSGQSLICISATGDKQLQKLQKLPKRYPFDITKNY